MELVTRLALIVALQTTASTHRAWSDCIGYRRAIQRAAARAHRGDAVRTRARTRCSSDAWCETSTSIPSLETDVTEAPRSRMHLHAEHPPGRGRPGSSTSPGNDRLRPRRTFGVRGLARRSMSQLDHPSDRATSVDSPLDPGCTTANSHHATILRRPACRSWLNLLPRNVRWLRELPWALRFKTASSSFA